MAIGRREDHVQLVQRAEAREKLPKGGDDAAILGQQRKNVGVKGQPPHAGEGRERQAQESDEHQPPSDGSPTRR